jgi:hypothetical protein
MTHHILVSVVCDEERQADVAAALGAQLEQLGFTTATSPRPGLTMVTAEHRPAEDPVPEPTPEPAEPEVPTEVPPEAQAVAAEVPPVELELELPVKMEGTCHVLDLSSTEELLVATSKEEVSQLVVDAVDASVPGFVSFSHANTSYKFPVTEGHFIQASVDTNGKRKRIKLQVIESNSSTNLPAGTVIFGAGDAELLTQGA